MTEIRTYDFPGRKLRFESEAPPLEGLDLFCGDFISPLVAEIALSHFDAELGLKLDDPAIAQPFWMVRAEAAAHTHPRPAWENEGEVTVPVLNGAVLSAWVASHRESVDIDFHELLIRAVRVRLPWTEGGTLSLRVGAHIVESQVEREGGALYAAGPLDRSSAPPPLALSMTRDLGVSSLDVDVHWALWADPHAPGFADLQRACSRLEDAGWRRTYSDIPLA